ncbi:hypothetical protein H632_c5144p0, partial [Helicosporidium sp. ATCC 50920]
LLHCAHPALDAVAVRGLRLDAADGGGPRTRSRARRRPERWSSVPLKTKVALMLVDAFIEDAVQKEPEEEDDWEDASSDEEGEGGGEALDGETGPVSGAGGAGEQDEDDDEDEQEALRIWQEVDPAAAKLDVGFFVKERFAFAGEHLPREMALVDAQLTDYQRQWLGKLFK